MSGLPGSAAPGPLVRVFPTREELFAAAALRVSELARASVLARGRFSIALSGGSTPAGLYNALSAQFRTEIDWGRTHAWWSDERVVGHDHKDSNCRAAREALLSRVAIPEANVHPVPTGAGSARGAEAYERELRAFDGLAPLDLTLLGMGADGHTASLFPGSPALDEASRWVVPAVAPPSSPVADRVTFTLPLIATSRHALFLVTGADKRGTLGHVLGGGPLPAARVRCASAVEWFVDAAAAGQPAPHP